MAKPSLCLNMIVKNEADRIERCLASAAPYIKSLSIMDTGSTDDTLDRITDFAKKNNISCEVCFGEFRDFAFARNSAFKFARTVNRGEHWCQFALMIDADMELVVTDPHAFNILNANEASYDMMQKGGSISYANRRIVNLQAGTDNLYVGVTHEYLDLPAAGMIGGASFVDHADGSNRKEKYIRDAQLLENALKETPDNGRYLYYLGQSYQDWAGTDAVVAPYATDAYDKRIALGGWDEETYMAKFNRAHVWKLRGDEDRYVAGMLDTYSFRPTRAEPLYELAKHYREKGNSSAATLFAKHGARIERPSDLLFVNDFVYEHGLRYEYSVSGYYDEKERNSAFQITDDLALDPTCPAEYRWSARTNLYWYTKPLSQYCPSFKGKRIEFDAPAGYTAMNPSIEECNGILKCNVRCVNYKIDEQGRYMIGPLECHDAPIDTRNFVCTLDNDFNVVKDREVIWDRPAAKFPMVTGLEDIRLYRSRGDLCFSACVREQASNGTCQQWRGRLVFDVDDKYFLVKDASAMSEESAIEKNWMPMPNNGAHDFVYRLDTIVHADAPLPGRVATVTPGKLHVGDISGGSQMLLFRHGWLCVVHEASTGPDGKRTYWHRFAWFNHDKELRRLSLPFVFYEKQIEFCAGLAYHPNGRDLIISFGVRDEEAHLATVKIEEAAQMIWKFHES